MIIIRIEGKQSAGKTALAERIAMAERLSGKVVSVYHDGARLPASIPETADVVIIVMQAPHER